MQIKLHPVVPGRPTHLLQPRQLMLIRDVLFMTKIIRATDAISNSLPRPLYGDCLDFFARVP